MKLKVRVKDKSHNITDLDENSKILDLKKTIQTFTGVPPSLQELKVGYPPRVCNAGDHETLTSAGIQNGEVIIFTELSEVVKPSKINPPTTNPPTTNPPTINPPKINPPTINPPTTNKPKKSDNYNLPKNEIISVPVNDGFVILREMEDDNSCLFRAIERSKNEVQRLRQIIIDTIKNDPTTYSDVFLGRPRNEYCSWIAQKNSWGGAIVWMLKPEESIDLAKENTINAYMLYTDYDSIAYAPLLDASPEFDQTIFSPSDETFLTAVLEIANKMRQLHKYTYTTDFTIRCDQCKKGLRGEKEAAYFYF
ncbi:4648_t:CDS:10 [Diversispora eburnea]|uniref:Ubiquitin thioesterase OTU n=1 Tax=Diversispora eburnea TaxID=1213867 RepID=A0A9N9F1K8_9GLOM|nr:4648_t:CDS:10 [Diversispora eburnea]